MAVENETVETVLREINEAHETWKRSEIANLPTQYLKEWHDRIEAAHKREVEELCGLLEEATDCADEFQKFFEQHPYLCKYTRDVIKKSKKAMERIKDDSPSCENN